MLILIPLGLLLTGLYIFCVSLPLQFNGDGKRGVGRNLQNVAKMCYTLTKLNIRVPCA